MAFHKSGSSSTSVMLISAALGVLISMGISLGLTLLFSGLISGQIIKETMEPYCALLTVLMSAFLGALSAAIRSRGLRLQTCFITGGLYFLALLTIGAVLFHRGFSNIVLHAVLITVGACAAGLLGMKPKKTRNRKMKNTSFVKLYKKHAR